MINKPQKKIKTICTALGNDYSIKVIDLEYVIYRDLGNGFDFEISGLDNSRKKFNATLYIWRNEGYRIVETISNIPSLEDLKYTLEKACEKYR